VRADLDAARRAWIASAGDDFNERQRREKTDTLAHKRPDLHVVITGRNAKPELIEFADLVTEMELVKHPFRSGVKAQIGVEF